MIRLVILSDGKAGHVSSSRGMAKLIEAAAPSRTEVLEIRLRAKFLRPILRLLINSGVACTLTRLIGPAWPGLFYRGYRPITGDAALSAGGDTLYLNAYAGRCLGMANFFCGSLRGVDADRFKLIVHTRRADLPHWRALSVLPIALDIDQAERAAADFARERLDGRRQNYWALMIGGPGNGYRFDAESVVAMLAQCAELARQAGKQLLVSTSRRTGASAEAAIADWLEGHLDAPVAYTVLYGRRPEKVAGAFMRLAELVLCSEESTSMLSESVYCGRPVIALAPADAHPAPDQADFIAELVERRHLLRMTIGAADSTALDTFLADWQAYDGAEHRRLQADMLAALRAALR
jgi:mitochondrial fission protein ELM1